jgi:hypothetical protein
VRASQPLGPAYSASRLASCVRVVPGSPLFASAAEREFLFARRRLLRHRRAFLLRYRHLLRRYRVLLRRRSIRCLAPGCASSLTSLWHIQTKLRLTKDQLQRLPLPRSRPEPPWECRHAADGGGGGGAGGGAQLLLLLLVR